MDERLDREDVSRVLARAHELQDAAAPPGDDGGVSPEALIEAASEVGIDRDAVRDALAIDRLSTEPPEPRALDRLAGPAAIVVERELSLTPRAVLVSMEEWLTAAHRLRCHRRSDGSVDCSKRTDMAATTARVVAGIRGEGRLGAVRSMTVRAVPLITGSTPARARTLVRVEVDRQPSRQMRLGGGAALGAVGAGVGGASALAGTVVLLPVVAVPLVAGGYLVARSGRAQADRVELEVERLLTAVEHGDRPTGILGRVANRARRAVESAVTRQ